MALAADGTVWFTDFFNNRIGGLAPSTGTFDMVTVQGSPYKITVATGGSVWFIGRFDTTIGRLDPATGQVTEFPISRSPHDDIAAAPDGNPWYTMFDANRIATLQLR